MPGSLFRSTFASLRGPARTLAVLHLIDSIGSGLFMTGSAVYFVVVAGLPVTMVGLGMSLAGFSGFVSSVVLGRVADRVGPRPLLAGLLATLVVLYAVYPFVDSVWLFLPVVIATGALEYGCGPAFGSLIMELVDESGRVTARAALRSLFNVGFSVGALAGAGLIALGGQWLQLLPLGNGLTFLLAAALVLRLPRSDARTGGLDNGRFTALRDLPFLSVIGASALLAMHSAVLLVGVPIWIVHSTDLPHSLVPLILVVNTILVVLLQVAASKGCDALDGSVTAGRKAGAFAVLACAVLAMTAVAPGWATVPALLLAVLGFTAAELWQSASGFGLSFGLAPDAARGEYLGAFHLHVVIQATLGPVLVTGLIALDPSSGWLLMALVFAIGALSLGPATSWAERTASLRAGGVPTPTAMEKPPRLAE